MAGTNNHGSYLSNLLGDAKKGFENEKAKDQHDPANQSAAPLTAEQLAHAQNILGMIGTNTSTQPNQNNRATDHYHSPSLTIDINGHRHNPDSGPSYYKHKATTTSRIPGIHYPVSDTIARCNKCTRYRDCDRHRRPRETKTGVSLCKESHLRMVLYWDVSDPENREKSWRLGVEEMFERFFNPERERGEHEASGRKGKDGGGKESEDGNDGEVGFEDCHPQDPSSRIKALAKRIVEDHNADAKDKARREYLDLKGRDYTTRPQHWGARDPFVPAAGADAKEGFEWLSAANEDRVERELRVLLQMWYRSRLGREERGKDTSSEDMRETWRKKMKQRGIEGKEEVEFNEHGERVGEEKVVVKKTVEMVRAERFKMSTKEERDAKAKELAIEEMAKKREMDREALSKVKKSVKTTRNPGGEPKSEKSVGDASDESGRKVSQEPTSKTTAAPREAKVDSPEIDDQRLAGFEQWANEVEEEENKPTAPTEDKDSLKSQPVPEKRASGLEITARERKLLAAMKEKAAEDVESEPELESEPEPEEEEEEEDEESSDESSEEEPLAKSKKTSTKARASESTSKKTKAQSPSSSPKLSASRSPTPSPEPKPKSKPTKSTLTKITATTKRKATAPADVDKPNAKKSKYKSNAIIEDSDEEADYELPDPPSPPGDGDISEQRKGWALAKVVVSAETESESVKVVQTDSVEVREVESQVVVERGTTIVTAVESVQSNESRAIPPPEEDVMETGTTIVTKVEGAKAIESRASPPPEEVETNESMKSLFGEKDEGGSGAIEVEEEEKVESPSSNQEQKAEADEHDEEQFSIARIDSQGSDESELSEPPSFNSDAEDEGKNTSSTPLQDERGDAVPGEPTFVGSNGSDSDESDLPEAPPSEPEAAEQEQPPTITYRRGSSGSDDSDLSEPPSSTSSSSHSSTGYASSISRKRKVAFSDDIDEQHYVEPLKKAKKSVRFDEEVYYDTDRKRRMSIEYVLGDDEVEEDDDDDEGIVEKDEMDSDEKGSSGEVCD